MTEYDRKFDAIVMAMVNTRQRDNRERGLGLRNGAVSFQYEVLREHTWLAMALDYQTEQKYAHVCKKVDEVIVLDHIPQRLTKMGVVWFEDEMRIVRQRILTLGGRVTIYYDRTMKKPWSARRRI